jgi:hypothetical protein
MKTFKLFVFILFAIATFSGCKKESTTTSSGDYTSPTIAAKDTLIAVPSQMRVKSKTDYILASGVMMIDATNSLSKGYFSALAFNQSSLSGSNVTTNSDGSKTYTIKSVSASIYLTYYHSSSKSFWKYEMEASGIPRYTYYYAEESGNTGSFSMYYPGTSNLGWKDSWSIANNVTSATITTYSEDGVTITSKWVATSNLDKSGTLKIYGENNALQWDMTWDKNGNGTYTTYSSSGTPTNGSF